MAREIRSDVTAGNVVGREPELAALAVFLAPGSELPALLLVGEPGIGKSLLCESGIGVARAAGRRVLSARPSNAETQLSFAGVCDLFDTVAERELATIPAPQRRALEIALLRADPGEEPPQQQAIALGLLGALRHLARRERVLVAIDDLQWLDQTSAQVLAFAARRLTGHDVGFLLACRPDCAPSLVQALEPGGVTRVDVGPLSIGAVRRLLASRLELRLSRRSLQRIWESTLGNPLFALELGRALLERGGETTVDQLELPARVDDMLEARVSKLDPTTRRLLTAVALCPGLRAYELEVVADAAAIEEATESGLLVVENGHVRPSHPLVAAAAMRRSKPLQRREIRLALAGVVADEQLNARLRAGSTTRPDEALAGEIAAAADAAGRRGRVDDAAYLAERALSLTPAGSPRRAGRLLFLADALTWAGEQPERVVELVESELASFHPGTDKARALFRLACTVRGWEQIRHYQDEALKESAGDPGLHATITAVICEYDAVIRLEGLREAEPRLLAVLDDACAAGADEERQVLYALSWIRSLRGSAIADLRTRFDDASTDSPDVGQSPHRVAGQQLVWRGEVAPARELLTGLAASADARGEGYNGVLCRVHLCELELRTGNWDAAEQTLAEIDESSDRELLAWPMLERCRALVAAGRGTTDEAEAWATSAIDRADSDGVLWDRFEALRARGIVSLLAGDAAAAVAATHPVWEHTRRVGIDDPGVFPVAPELVEALCELDRPADAAAVTSRLLELSERHAHPWGLATAKRCAALIGFADGDADGARAALEEAASSYERLGLRFERARCLLDLGRAERRQRKWGSARRTLERAAAAFDELSSTGWLELTRSELARVGARRPGPTGALTAAEQRVAALAAKGLANKEIAAALFISVHTVEIHLSRAYRKLDIRSRSQLARLAQDGKLPSEPRRRAR